MKNKYWKNFGRNYPLVIGHTFAIILGGLLAWVFLYTMLEFTKQIQDPYGQVLALVILLMSFVKLLYWIGNDLLNQWANKICDAFEI